MVRDLETQLLATTVSQRSEAFAKYETILRRADDPRPKDAAELAALLPQLGRSLADVEHDIALVLSIQAGEAAEARLPDVQAASHKAHCAWTAAVAQFERELAEVQQRGHAAVQATAAAASSARVTLEAAKKAVRDAQLARDAWAALVTARDVEEVRRERLGAELAETGASLIHGPEYPEGGAA